MRVKTWRRTRGVALLLLAVGGCDEPAGEAADPCAEQAAGTACTWLGLKGREGFNGDGHARYDTQVFQPQDLVFPEDGSAWFSDFNNHLVRKVQENDTVTTAAGWTDPIFPGDGPLGGIPPGGGAGPDWQLFHPAGMYADADGSLVVAAWHNHKLLSIDPASGWVTVLAGGGASGGGAGFDGDGGPATEALLQQPSDATGDDAGNVYVVDQLNLRIRRVDADGVISTAAGTGVYGSSGDGGLASEATFSFGVGSNPNPSGAVLHHEGKLYVADTEAHRIRVIDLDSGIIDAFAGTGTPGFAGDGGAALAALLNAPRDLEIGPEGDLYVADTDNGAVRAIDRSTGVIRTVVGTGALGLDDAEQLPASKTQLRRPFGLAFDGEGRLYVIDSLNSRVVRVAL